MNAAVITLAAVLPCFGGGGDEYSFLTPSDDRWHYPFNFTPATRPIATTFSSIGNVTWPSFNDRDGILVVAWNTAAQIPSGECPLHYDVRSIRVTLTSVSNAAWLVDLTPDEWYTYDWHNDGVLNADGIPRGMPGDLDGESDDVDSGRPLELFGAGFGPTHHYATWTEGSFYVGANDVVNNARDPYPFVFQEVSGLRLHVEDSVKGTQNQNADPPVFHFTPTPWAIGVPQGYTPSAQEVPFDVTFDVDLSISDGLVRDYFQQQLAGGRLFVVITSLIETIQFGGGPETYPTFFNKEGLGLEQGAKAPRLDLIVRMFLSGDDEEDCDVDNADFVRWEDCYFGPDETPVPMPPMTTARCLSTFDFDNDGDVDLADHASFALVFTGDL